MFINLMTVRISRKRAIENSLFEKNYGQNIIKIYREKKKHTYTVYILEGILVDITNTITNLLLITNNRTF